MTIIVNGMAKNVKFSDKNIFKNYILFIFNNL